jgi:AcrR family transcriptional regulator
MNYYSRVPTTRAEQAEKTRQAVLEAARKLFHDHGYDATSLQQIADRMGVTKANVYYYFRTKAAILQAILGPMADSLSELLDTAEALEDRDARTACIVDGYVAQVLAAYRTVGHLNLSDPGMRRQIEITRTLDDLADRGLHIVFGDHPTPDEAAAYWILNDLAPILQRLDHLPDDQLQDTLRRLSLRVLRGATEAPCGLATPAQAGSSASIEP